MEQTLALITDAQPIVEMHLSADDMAAMIDGRLPANRRDQVESHLARCRECRAEFAAASVVVDTAPAREKTQRWWIPTAAAAVLVLAAVPLFERINSNSSAAGERADNASAATIVALAPPNETAIAADALVFTWRDVPGVATYRLSVVDSVGSEVYQLNTSDTTVGPIDRAKLARGSHYYWHVDALRADGTSIKSATISFSIRSR